VRVSTRAKVSVTVQRGLLHAVDKYVSNHQGIDRSKVFDEALHDWYAKRQEEELFDFYSRPEQLTDEQAAEYAGWVATRRAAAERIFERQEEKEG
jgi:hypothetical protein